MAPPPFGQEQRERDDRRWMENTVAGLPVLPPAVSSTAAWLAGICLCVASGDRVGEDVMSRSDRRQHTFSDGLRVVDIQPDNHAKSRVSSPYTRIVPQEWV